MAVLAAAAILPVLTPLFRGQRAGGDAASASVAIYRDQLEEVDKELSRGVIGEQEAAAARTEIARRLIKADAETAPEATTRLPNASRIAVISIIATPVLALAVYLTVGAPEYPAQPLAARPAAEVQDINTLVAQVEAHLARTPDDGDGWAALAPVYTRLGRLDDAAGAYGHIVRLLGSTAEREADHGEALVRAARGAVTPEAHAAFERALRLAPEDPRPRFYLAMALGQGGKAEEAKTAWEALIADAPANAQWLPAAQKELAALAQRGPAAADIEAAASLSDDDRQAMIEGMVASLDADLRENPEDAQRWVQLIRSYMVLGRPDDARAAVERAQTAFAGDAARLAVITAAVAELGLEEGAAR